MSQTIDLEVQLRAGKVLDTPPPIQKNGISFQI